MRTINAAGVVGLCLVSMVAVAACSQEVGAPESGSTHGTENKPASGTDKNAATLLASLNLGGDHRVEFYELAEGGDLLVHETGPIGGTVSVTDDMVVGKSMAELYQQLTAQTPELRKSTELDVLKLADGRAVNRQPNLDMTPPPEELASAAPEASGSADFDPYWDNWFQTQFCGSQVNGDNGICKMHWSGNANWFKQKYNFRSSVDNKGLYDMQHIASTCYANFPDFWNCHYSADVNVTVHVNNYSTVFWSGIGRRESNVIGDAYNWGVKYTSTQSLPSCGYSGGSCCQGYICNGVLLTCATGNNTCVACGQAGQPCCASYDPNQPPSCVNVGACQNWYCQW